MPSEWEHAIAQADVAQVVRLLDAGTDIDSLDRYGQTALMRAARGGQKELVALLISRGAALDVTAKFRLSALMLAVINHHWHIARRLMEAGANCAIRGSGAGGFYGQTAADLANALGQTALAEELRARE